MTRGTGERGTVSNREERRAAETDRGGGPSRRGFLRLAVATGAVAGLGGVGAGQENVFRLDGRISGWEARSPAELAGQTNPTLRLTPGESYTVVWTNVDGAPHNFVVVDGEGNQLVRTEIIEEQGATQTVEFEASAGMAEYFCEVHPGTMRGAIETGETTTPTGPETPEGPTIGLETVATGLTAPLDFDVANEDRDRRFVVDQTGQIYVHGPDGLEAEPFLDVNDRLVQGGDLGIEDLGGYDERGLLGLAFHPDFAENRRFFVYYSAPRRDGTPADYDHTGVLAEFRATADGSRADPDSERTVLEIPSPQDNHNGGAVAFGPDGYLYVSVGDGGSADDVGLGHVEDWYEENEGGNGQDVTENLLGSVLRIDVDGGASGTPGEGGDGADDAGDEPYGIPEDNPLVDTEGLPEQYAWGFRNPWRMSFDDEGRLFVGDAGQNLWEEVDLVERGGNYGWNVREGSHCFDASDPTTSPDDCPDAAPDEPPYDGQPLVDPIVEYRHREATEAFIDGSVVIGGYVYEPTGDAEDAVPELDGRYVFGNWSGSGVVEADGEIFAASPPADGDGQWSFEELRIAGTDDGRLGRYVYAFGQGRDGELYVLTTGTFRPEGDTGAVHRVVPPDRGEPVPPAGNETATGNETTAGNETTTGNATTDGNETATGSGGGTG